MLSHDPVIVINGCNVIGGCRVIVWCCGVNETSFVRVYGCLHEMDRVGVVEIGDFRERWGDFGGQPR